MKPYYNLSLRPGASNVCAVAVRFTNQTASDEIIVGQGETLSLLSLDPSGEIHHLRSMSFSTSIRSISYIPSVEGNLILVSLNTGGILKVEHPIGGPFIITGGAYFVNPVQFLAADCQAHAILVVPCKQNKFVYITRNLGDKPVCIEIPDSNTITYAVVALSDYKDEKNVYFAAIEHDRSEDDCQRHIAYYEARTEDNFQVTRSTVPVDSEANHLLAIPGGMNGPGGVLVITKHMVIYKTQDLSDVSAPLPGKDGRPEEHGALIVSSTTCQRPKKYGFFFLLQTEFGDIFRVLPNLRHRESVVRGFDIKHLDTIPVTYAMCFLDSDILFAASKTGNHALYKFSGSKLLRMDKNERILKMEVMELSGGIISLCSRGPVLSLHKFSPWMKMGKVAETSLKDKPNALWRVNQDVQERFTESIAVSYDKGTQFMDMSLEDGTQVILGNHRFDLNRPSLAVFTIGNGSTLQVHPRGIIIQGQEDLQPTNMQHMEGDIVKVAYNRFQVVVALRGRNLICYTVRTNQGYDTLKVRKRRQMDAEVVCLCISPVQEGRNHSFRLAVGLADNRIMILVLQPKEITEKALSALTFQTKRSPPESLLFLSPREYNKPIHQFLIAGLKNGLINRMVMYPSGRLRVSCSRYLGSRTPKLFSATVMDQQAIICLSDRPWIGYMQRQNQNSKAKKFLLTPLSCEALDFAASICCHRPQGVVAVTEDIVKLFTIEDFGDNFSEKTFCPDYTPESFVLHPQQELIIVISKGQRELSQGEQEDDKENKWVSHIMFLDPESGKTIYNLGLKEIETAHNVCTVNFDNYGEEYKNLLAVGISINEPLTGFIRIYRLLEEGKSLAVLQSTHVKGVPRALSQFKGALLAGIGPVLRMYDLVEGKLHMRCESRIFPDTCEIVSINVVGDRIYVGDNTQAIHCFKYSRTENQPYMFESGNVPSSVTAFLQIDSNTMAWADKFGNVFFAQILPEDSNEGTEKIQAAARQREESLPMM